MLQKLITLNHQSVELEHYLNTQPPETESIKAYNQTIEAAETLRMKVEAAYGPLCSFRSYAAEKENWQWKNDPWPWQTSANPSMAGKECM